MNNWLDISDVDILPTPRKYNCGIERILEFGRELSQMEQELEKENKLNDNDKKMLEVNWIVKMNINQSFLLITFYSLSPSLFLINLNEIFVIEKWFFEYFQDAFSLIAYSNPWSSPLGWQLCPTKRETVCRALNSAILGKLDYMKSTGSVTQIYVLFSKMLILIFR